MRALLRIALALCAAVPLLLPVVVLADTGNNQLVTSAGTYYVTQVGDGAIARVTVSGTGTVKVDSNYISGLPGDGPDSAVFASDGSLLASNFSAGSISRVDVAARKILTVQVNKTLVMPIADLAFDPSSNSVWGITYSGTGPTAIVRVDLGSGATKLSNPDGLTDMGGIAITETGSRVFVSTHAGTIAELDRNGHVVRKITVQGSPDGLSYDPSTGNLFAAGCGGICEIATGGAGASKLTYIKTFDAVDGDGIAADGKGHLYVAKSSCGSLCRLDLATDKAITVSDEIPEADDVVPLAGAGAGGGCQTLGSCFDGAAAAGLAAAGVGTVVFVGAAGWSVVRHDTTSLLAHTHAVTAHATAAAQGTAAAGAPGHIVHPPPAQGAAPPAEPTSHLQEESGDKLLEAGGAGIERAVGGAEVEALGGAEAGAEGAGLGGAARFARDEEEAEQKDAAPERPPDASPPPEPPPIPEPPDVPSPPEHPPSP